MKLKGKEINPPLVPLYESGTNNEVNNDNEQDNHYRLPLKKGE
ncbi:MAG: hypothetical protein ABR954_02705 [Dehalococcoidales bacterium]